MLELNQVHQGDCLELMGEIPDGSVDMCLTSPPYNINLRVHYGKYHTSEIKENKSSVKYINYLDNLSMDEYFNFNKRVLTECLRVSGVVFYNIQFLTGNKPALFKLIGEFSQQIKEFIIWDKVNAEPAMGKNILNSQFEVILVLEKNYPQSRQFNIANFKRGCETNLWKIKRGKKPTKIHGAVFPVALASKIIKLFTNEGDTILDPFSGSGTTGVACKRWNRNFILIEKEPEYCDIARRRLDAEDNLFTEAK